MADGLKLEHEGLEFLNRYQNFMTFQPMNEDYKFKCFVSFFKISNIRSENKISHNLPTSR